MVARRVCEVKLRFQILRYNKTKNSLIKDKTYGLKKGKDFSF